MSIANRRRKSLPVITLWFAALTVSGCGGAPAFGIFGAYFPAWMLCAALGIVSAIAARLFFVAKALTGALPYQLLVCSAIGMAVGAFSWLLLFGF